MFRVGQKVVCVDDGEPTIAGNWMPWDDDRPHKGRVYTVSGTGLIHPNDPHRLPCILVLELNRDWRWPLWAHRFRPVVERKASIEIFTKMLKPSRVDA